jgi:hypothetical protein
MQVKTAARTIENALLFACLIVIVASGFLDWRKDG